MGLVLGIVLGAVGGWLLLCAFSFVAMWIGAWLDDRRETE